MIDGYSEFNKKIREYKKEPNRILEMKNAITELKNSLEEFNIRLGQQKKKNKKQQTQQFILKFSNQRNKMKNNEESLGDLWDTISRST